MSPTEPDDAVSSRTHNDWVAAASRLLKGGDLGRLASRTADGIPIEPVYPKAQGAAAILGREARPWIVSQRVDHPVPGEANALALDDLANGATGLTLVAEGAVGAYGYGLPASRDAIRETLDGVVLEAVTIVVDGGAQAPEVARALVGLCEERLLNPGLARIAFGLDPLGALALTGRAALPWPEAASGFANLVVGLKQQGFGGPFAAADGRVVHAAGGSETQELAFVLSGALAYLRALEAGGMALAEAAGAIAFRVSADCDKVLTIAKLRALRRLWARVQDACGLDHKPAVIHAETAWRTVTKRDPWVNLLRATLATAAAGLGGADAVTVLPFTQALGLPDGFARRLARNTQLIALEEAHLWRVADPAGGSGAIESLTDRFCQAAWAGFQAIERQGGLFAALADGTLQGDIAPVSQARKRSVARRETPITGTSEFPNLAELPVSVLMPPQPSAAIPGGAVQVAALQTSRLAEPFESLRHRSDTWLAAKGRRPLVFLATLGPTTASSARTAFARNLFEVGGIEAAAGGELAATDAVLAAYRRSGADAACLVSSDEVYACPAPGRPEVPWAVAVADALRAAGCSCIALAGQPGSLEPALRDAGVAAFIYKGCDVVAVLESVYDGIAAHGPGDR